MIGVADAASGCVQMPQACVLQRAFAGSFFELQCLRALGSCVCRCRCWPYLRRVRVTHAHVTYVTSWANQRRAAPSADTLQRAVTVFTLRALHVPAITTVTKPRIWPDHNLWRVSARLDLLAITHSGAVSAQFQFSVCFCCSGVRASITASWVQLERAEPMRMA